jgi:hypothetical protein
MKTKKQVVSILLLLALVTGCFAAMPQTSTAAPGNGNQDFTGTPVSVAVTTSYALIDEEAQIVITVENMAERGLPDVSIWINNARVKLYSDIGKGKSIEFVFDVDTSKAGEFDFDIEVWTRKGNKNFEAILGEPVTKTMTVVPSVEDEKTLLDALNDALEGITNSGDGPITVTVDGIDYVFETNNQNYNGNPKTLFCNIDGIKYKLVTSGNGALTISLA